MLTYNKANTFMTESMDFLETLINQTSPKQRDAFFCLKNQLDIDITGTKQDNEKMIKQIKKDMKKNKFFYFLNLFNVKKFHYQKKLNKLNIRLKAINTNTISSNRVLKTISLSISCLNQYLEKDNLFENWSQEDAFSFSFYHELGHLLQNEYLNFDADLTHFLDKHPSITNYLNRKDKRFYNLFSFVLPTYKEQHLTHEDVGLALLLDAIFSNVNTVKNSYKKEIKTNLEECFADIYALLFMSLKNNNFIQNKKQIIQLRKTELSKSNAFGHYTVNALENLMYVANQYRISIKKLDFNAYHKLIKIVATKSLIDLLLMRLKKNDLFAQNIANDIYLFIKNLDNQSEKEEVSHLMAPQSFEVINFSPILGEDYLALNSEKMLYNFVNYLNSKIVNFKLLSLEE